MFTSSSWFHAANIEQSGTQLGKPGSKNIIPFNLVVVDIETTCLTPENTRTFF